MNSLTFILHPSAFILCRSVAESVDGALAAVDDCVFRSPEAEGVRGFVDGVAFADGAQVDLHARRGEVDQVLFVIREDSVESGALHDLRELIGRWDATL